LPDLADDSPFKTWWHSVYQFIYNKINKWENIIIFLNLVCMPQIKSKWTF